MTKLSLPTVISVAFTTLALASTSFAGTLSFTGSEYRYTAASGEVNGVDLRDQPYQFNLSDTAPMTVDASASATCALYTYSGYTITCTPTTTSWTIPIRVRLGDQNDTMDRYGFGAAYGDLYVNGDDGDDTITDIEDEGDYRRAVIRGGLGNDTISSDIYRYGTANATIIANDKQADTITCGSGTQRVVADGYDTITSRPDCELLRIS